MDRFRTHMPVHAVIVVLVSLSVGHVMGSEGPPPVLNPKNVVSPSGEYLLHVNPSELNGGGSGTYSLSKNGVTLWSGEKPYTLWEAGVTDKGLVAGYAYTHGWRGFAKHGGYKAGMGDFHVVILDPLGNEILNLVTKREHSRYLHTPPNPLARGMILDHENDRFAIRIVDADVNRSSESWWVYRISTGKALDKFEPKRGMPESETTRYVISAKHVAATPLTLIHWWRYEQAGEDGNLGARFSLIDQEGKTVWYLDKPRDYSISDDRVAQNKLMQRIRNDGVILSTDTAREFDLHFVADSKRVTFSVSQGANGKWQVKEIKRIDYEPPPKEPIVNAMLPSIVVKRLDPVVLRGDGMRAVNPIRHVRDFVFDDQGRFGFLRGEKKGHSSFVRINPNGNVDCEIGLDEVRSTEKYQRLNLGWIGGDEFVVTLSTSGVDAKAVAWLVNCKTRIVRELSKFEFTTVGAIEGFSDGGFVILGTTRYSNTMVTTVYAFDHEGNGAWQLRHAYDNDPSHLFSPKDIAVTTDQKVAVVDVIRHTVQLFDRNGKYLDTVSLDDVWKRKASYPSDIAADASGGYIVHDFNGDPPIVWMDVSGKVRRQFSPRHKDGRTFNLSAGVKAAPDGRLWTCDGDSLLRLNEDGIVDLVLGESLDTSHLDQVSGIEVDSENRICAVDSRTATIHVFDANGSKLHVCESAPTDFGSPLWTPNLTIDSKGHVFLGGDAKYVQFSSTGERVGTVELPLDSITQTWYAHPKPDRSWCLGYHDLFLLDDTLKPIRTISRRPDGDWLEIPHSACVAPDGSIAVVAIGDQIFATRSATVNCYGPTGEPRSTIELPLEMGRYVRVAYDGSRLVVAGDEGRLLLVDDQGTRQVLDFEFESEKPPYWYPYFAAEGRELWLFDANVRKPILQRCEMP